MHVPTRSISLTPEQDAFVEKVVRDGEYQNASEAVRDALRLLQQQRREDALKLKALRAAIKAGIHELESGDSWNSIRRVCVPTCVTLARHGSRDDSRWLDQ